MRCAVVASVKNSILLREINRQLRHVRQTQTARIYSPPKLLAELDWLLMDPPDYDSPDDLRELDDRIGR
jgi:hypothetical protein